MLIESYRIALLKINHCKVENRNVSMNEDDMKTYGTTCDKRTSK